MLKASANEKRARRIGKKQKEIAARNAKMVKSFIPRRWTKEQMKTIPDAELLALHTRVGFNDSVYAAADWLLLHNDRKAMSERKDLYWNYGYEEATERLHMLLRKRLMSWDRK